MNKPKIQAKGENTMRGFFRNKFLRSNPRRKERAAICVLVEEPGKEQDFFDKTQNISENGIFVETKNPQKKGEDITIRFALPGSQVITAMARVSRVAKKRKFFSPNVTPGMGLEFTHIDPKSRELIRNFTKK